MSETSLRERQLPSENPWYMLATAGKDHAENTRHWNGYMRHLIGVQAVFNLRRAYVTPIELPLLSPDEMGWITRNIPGLPRELPPTISLSGLNFARPVFFQDFYFPVYVTFEESIFKQVAYFEKSIFEKAAHFAGSIFEEVANFAGSSFGGYAHFAGSSFKGVANFAGSSFGDMPTSREAPLRKTLASREASSRERSTSRKAPSRERLTSAIPNTKAKPAFRTSPSQERLSSLQRHCMKTPIGQGLHGPPNQRTKRTPPNMCGAMTAWRSL